MFKYNLYLLLLYNFRICCPTIFICAKVLIIKEIKVLRIEKIKVNLSHEVIFKKEKILLKFELKIIPILNGHLL